MRFDLLYVVVVTDYIRGSGSLHFCYSFCYLFSFFSRLVFLFGRIERVVIAGVKTEPSSATLTVAGSATTTPLGFAYDAAAGLMTVRKPDVCVAEDFDIRLSFYSAS